MKNNFLSQFISLILITSCSTNISNKQKNNEYQVTTPLITDTVIVKEYVADIQSVQNIEIRARVKGYIEKIYVDEGKPVTEGQILFTINSQYYREELNKAKSILKSAAADARTLEIEVNNIRRLVENNVVSQSELDKAMSKLDAANAKVEDARSDEATAALNLAYTEIKAPYNGVINRIPNKRGSLIDDGTLLTSISDNKFVYVYFNVSEVEYYDYIMLKTSPEKSEVRLVLANGQLYPAKGMIETVEGEIDRTTGNIAFRARFENQAGILKHGASGKILLNRKVKNAMLIPQKTTFEIQDNTYVFIVDSNNVVHQRSIKPASRIGDLYLIESGLEKDDTFLFEGIQLVRDGDKIETKFVTPAEIYPK